MTDPLEPLRELPLPEIPRTTTARIREAAHRKLTAPRGRGSAWRALAMAALIAFCISHLGWTMAFLAHVYAR